MSDPGLRADARVSQGQYFTDITVCSRSSVHLFILSILCKDFLDIRYGITLLLDKEWVMMTLSQMKMMISVKLFYTMISNKSKKS